MAKKTNKDKLDKATKALLGMGSATHTAPTFTQRDLDRRFRMRVDRKGKGKIEEVTEYPVGRDH